MQQEIDPEADEAAVRALFLDGMPATGREPSPRRVEAVIHEVRRQTDVRDLLDVTLGGMFRLLDEWITRFGPRR